MTKFFVVLLTIMFGLVSAHAQQRSQTPSVPKKFLPLYEGYKGWEPEGSSEPFTNSLYNWAIRAQEIAGDNNTLIKQASGWLFSRSETTVRMLATVYRSELRQLFGERYTERQIEVVFVRPYNAETQKLYDAWYYCVAKSKVTEESSVGVDQVLSYINYYPHLATGHEESCATEYESLSFYYGLTRLSADQLTAIGFLARRYDNHKDDPRVLSAEAVRKIAQWVFADEASPVR